MSDQMVLKTQQWLNQNYSGRAGYGNNITEDGITGWGTIHALLKALQIELGITNTSTSFGPTTISNFNSRFPSGIIQQSSSDKTENNIYGIIQGALWCKGYSGGSNEITKNFYIATGYSIERLKEDAGCSETSSTVTVNIMKALMSMDQFKTVSGGTSVMREIQKSLNFRYEPAIGLMPCDGIYSRQMNAALIKVLQIIERYTGSAVDGSFGDGTKARIPLIPNGKFNNGNTMTANEISDSILLLRYLIYCNGYTSVDISSSLWDSTLSNYIRDFQTDLILPLTGIGDVNTWMSLLLSKGNSSRNCVACDTRFEMTQSRINYLKNNGYEIVGRYLTGGDYKALRIEEPRRIINNGLKFFPIFQESGTSYEYFTKTRGMQNIVIACETANNLSIPLHTVIYFAVDFDATDNQITNYILPYFNGLNQALASEYNNLYKIGVYGTRNVCQKVLSANYASTCFVSDMSTGYSGNMGFKMPTIWNFDQFCELKKINTGDSENMDLDKVAYNSKFQFLPVSQLDKHPILRDNTESYYLGTAQNITINPSYGNYFTVLSNHLKIQYKISSDTDLSSALVGNIVVYKYGSDYEITHIYGIKRDELVLIEIDTTYGADYRLQYYCEHSDGSTGASGNVEIYLSTGI